MEQELFEYLQKEKIREALQLYARGVYRRDWALVERVYHADAFDDHGGYKGGVPGLLEWLERRHVTIDQSMHFLGNGIVDLLSDTTAVAETNCGRLCRNRGFGADIHFPGDCSPGSARVSETNLIKRYEWQDVSVCP